MVERTDPDGFTGSVRSGNDSFGLAHYHRSNESITVNTQSKEVFLKTLFYRSFTMATHTPQKPFHWASKNGINA